MKYLLFKDKEFPKDFSRDVFFACDWYIPFSGHEINNFKKHKLHLYVVMFKRQVCAPY